MISIFSMILFSLPSIDLPPLNIFHIGVNVYTVKDGFLLTSWQDSSAALVDPKGEPLAVYTQKGQGPDGLTTPSFVMERGGGYVLLNKRKTFIFLKRKDNTFELLDDPHFQKPEISLFDVAEIVAVPPDRFHFLHSDSLSTQLLAQTLSYDKPIWTLKQSLSQTSTVAEAIYWSNQTFFATRYQLAREDQGYAVLVFEQLPTSLFEATPKLRLAAEIPSKLAPFASHFKAIVTNACKTEDGYIVEFAVHRGKQKNSGSLRYWDFFDQSGSLKDRVLMDDTVMVPIKNGPGAFMMQGDYEQLDPLQ